MSKHCLTKPLYWMSSTKADIQCLPVTVRSVFGHALYLAQCGSKHLDAKPLKGFGGAGVLEVVEEHVGNTYRAVYTVRFEQAVYVLHVFQKRSTHGIATPKKDLELIRSRLTQAETAYKKDYGPK